MHPQATIVPAQPLLARDPRVAALLAQMTVEEKAGMLAGTDDWHLRGIPRLGIPSVRVTDCGHGVSLCGDRASPATCLPTGIGMASTWNVPLLEQAGRVIGRETRALGCSVMLGPKLNLHRHPLNGRSFETFSEDPVLAGTLGAALIRGIQAEGVAACAKAVAANNQQNNQGKVSSEVDERTMRELYLRAFEIAVEDGDPALIMTSYNKLNGVYTSESPWLLNQVIKSDWDFRGCIVSDWRAVHTTAVYGSGLDLEMPGPGTYFHRDQVLRALAEGRLSLAELDDHAGRVLGVILAYGKEEATAPEVAAQLDTPEHRVTALAVAEEAIVLLKNDGDILPLDADRLGRVLVVGPNAAIARLGGGGSASVTPFIAISPLDGIRAICGDRVDVQYLEGCPLAGTMEPIEQGLTHTDATGATQPGLWVEYSMGLTPRAQPNVVASVPAIDFSWGWAAPCDGIIKGPFAVRFSGTLVPPVSGRYRFGVHAQEGCARLVIDGATVIDAWDSADDGNFEAKYLTRQLTCECELIADVPVTLRLDYGKRAARAGVRLEWEVPGATSPIDRAVAAARDADAVIVCTGISNLYEGGAQDRTSIDMPERQLELVSRLAAANPRTIVVLNNGGPLAMPFADSVPALIEAWYPGQAGGLALAKILFGQTNPSGRLPDTLAHRLDDHAAIAGYPGDGERVVYHERLAVGYRHFDAAGITPHFPFGFGLSYTRFVIGAPQADLAADGSGTVRVQVRNVGERAGKEVVQLYIRPHAAPVSRPVQELRAFHKLELAPGATSEVVFTLQPRDFAWYEVDRQAWTVSPGVYTIAVGRHSRDLQTVKVVIADPAGQPASGDLLSAAR